MLVGPVTEADADSFGRADLFTGAEIGLLASAEIGLLAAAEIDLFKAAAFFFAVAAFAEVT